jgi:hypothetical protein
MKRVRNLLAIAIPSMFIGGLLFGDNHSRAAADTGELVGYWPAASDVAGTTVAQRAKRVPSVPTVPPVPPVPPTGRRYGGGVSVKINGNQIQIEGIDNLVNAHLEAVRQMLRNNPNIPKDMRDRITARMDRVKSIVDKHLKNVKTTDLDQLGEQMEKMGEELEKAMDGLDTDIAQLGKDFGKDFGKKLAKSFKRDKWGPDPDPDTDTDTDTDTDIDTDVGDTADSDDDLRDSIGDLKDMALKPAQKDAIVKLRTDSDARVAAEKKQLDDASKRLETALGDPRTSDADIARYVDQISSHEASIRKARLIAWVNARRVLDPDQVRKIENAAAKKKTQP